MTTPTNTIEAPVAADAGPRAEDFLVLAAKAQTDGLVVINNLDTSAVLDFRKTSSPYVLGEIRNALSDKIGWSAVERLGNIYSLGLLGRHASGIADALSGLAREREDVAALAQLLGWASEVASARYAAQIARGEVEFGGLIEFYTPGMEVVVQHGDDLVGGVVQGCEITYGWLGAVANVKIYVLQTLGSSVSEGVYVGRVREFAGPAAVTSLAVRPISDTEKQALSERGKIFRRFVGASGVYCDYTGSLSQPSWEGNRMFRAQGRVMVDSATFRRMASGDFQQCQRALNLQVIQGGGDDFTDIFGSGADVGCGDGESAEAAIAADDLWRAFPLVVGFSLAAKRWGILSVKHLKEIEFKARAFDQLVLPEDEKALVRALVENQQVATGDIISGKGGGVIFLLHGPPGQGKTLTAEAIAEVLRRPLYSISVGELGTDPETLENKMRAILDVAAYWDAVLLLDEADIFLEQRDERDVVRNAMVGVFLRLLEYHQGVLFLTTNRVKNIDEAFYSRVSVALHLTDAGGPSKLERIWANLLEAAGIEGMDVANLATHKLNGRQVRNVIRLSQTLAAAEGGEVDGAMIARVIELTTRFDPHKD